MSGVGDVVKALANRDPEPELVKKVTVSGYCDEAFADALQEMAKVLKVSKSRLAGEFIAQGVLEGLQTLRGLGYEGLPVMLKLDNPSLPFEGGE